jgi:hypothetical protein
LDAGQLSLRSFGLAGVQKPAHERSLRQSRPWSGVQQTADVVVPVTTLSSGGAAHHQDLGKRSTVDPVAGTTLTA